MVFNNLVNTVLLTPLVLTKKYRQFFSAVCKQFEKTRPAEDIEAPELIFRSPYLPQ